MPADPQAPKVDERTHCSVCLRRVWESRRQTGWNNHRADCPRRKQAPDVSHLTAPGVGDRVRVEPESCELARLRGEWGTVEHVYSGYPLEGGLLVRLDVDGLTLAIGSEAVSMVARNA